MTQYVASPPTTDPAKLLRERNIQVRHLRHLLAEADEETAKREQVINGLIAGIAGNDADE